MPDAKVDPFVFELIHGRPVPSVPTTGVRQYTTREIALLFGGEDERWRVKWENHFNPDDRPALFVVEGRTPVPLRRGELPRAGQTCYSADELTGNDANPEFGGLVKPAWSYAALLALHASSEPVADPATSVASDAPDDNPFLPVVPVDQYVNRLRATGMPPATALYTVALIVVSDVATATQDPDFPWPEFDMDDVPASSLGHQFNEVTATLRALLDNYATAEARRVIRDRP